MYDSTTAHFEKEIIPFYNDIYKYLLHLGCDEHLAEDICQSTMVKAWDNRKKLLRSDYQKPWLLQVAKNDYISHKRASSKHHFYNINDLNLTIEQSRQITADFSDMFILHEDIKLLKTAMQHLDEKYAEPIRLRYFGDLSHKEIAKILDLNENTARSLVARGLSKLSEEIYIKTLSVFQIPSTESNTLRYPGK